jgi:hypothetical protein
VRPSQKDKVFPKNAGEILDIGLNSGQQFTYVSSVVVDGVAVDGIAKAVSGSLCAFAFTVAPKE